MQPRYIGVIGSGDDVPDLALNEAERVGVLIAEGGGILVCGGRSGVMEAACRGASLAGGLTVGILPGLSRDDANPHVTVAIPTGLGFSLRNFITVRSSDVIIMIHGEVGTLSEAVLSYQHGTPLIALSGTGGWANRLRETAMDEGSYLDTRQLVKIMYSNTPEEAVRLAFEIPNKKGVPSKI